MGEQYRLLLRQRRRRRGRSDGACYFSAGAVRNYIAMIGRVPSNSRHVGVSRLSTLHRVFIRVRYGACEMVIGRSMFGRTVWTKEPKRGLLGSEGCRGQAHGSALYQCSASLGAISYGLHRRGVLRSTLLLDRRFWLSFVEEGRRATTRSADQRHIDTAIQQWSSGAVIPTASSTITNS